MQPTVANYAALAAECEQKSPPELIWWAFLCGYSFYLVSAKNTIWSILSDRRALYTL